MSLIANYRIDCQIMSLIAKLSSVLMACLVCETVHDMSAVLTLLSPLTAPGQAGAGPGGRAAAAARRDLPVPAGGAGEQGPVQRRPLQPAGQSQQSELQLQHAPLPLAQSQRGAQPGQ